MTPARAAAPSFGEALRYWLKLGCISFGGPAGQIALMQTELVEKRRWISQGRFLHALNYCMVLPGPEAQQLATYLGWLLHGVRGGVAAGLLFVLPSLLLLIGLSWAYLALGPAISTTVLAGVKPAVVAVVAFAAWRIGRRTLTRPALWGLSAASLLMLGVVSASVWVFPLLVLSAAVAGWTRPGWLSPIKTSDKSSLPGAAALIDDDTPSPAHAGIDRRRLLQIAGVGTGAGALVFSALWLIVGTGTLTRMAAFFTQAALLTFGGAYAVMPYVFQNAVETFAWVTPAQMLDGLALGESTPGPLIMVVAFIGYLGAAGAGNALFAGIGGALVATFFTFLPSFLFILVGAPLVEKSRGWRGLAAPLTAVTAAVVGAILHLALVLGLQVLLPAGTVDGFALALSAGALLALVRGWLGVVPVIVLCAVLGWARTLI